jgi:hypothetical protein
VVQEVSKVAAIWAVEGALLLGIAACSRSRGSRCARFAEGTKRAIGGALLASMNTARNTASARDRRAARLPGRRRRAAAIPDPLVNEASP